MDVAGNDEGGRAEAEVSSDGGEDGGGFFVDDAVDACVGDSRVGGGEMGYGDEGGNDGKIARGPVSG